MLTPAQSAPAPPSAHGVAVLRARPASARGRKTLDKILTTTIELAAEVGFEAINTNLIAARAGVNIASLYKYFPNKQAIFLTISEGLVAAFHAEVKALVSQIDDGRPWREAVAEGIRLAARRRLDSPGERAIRMALRLAPETQGIDAAESQANADVISGLILRRSAASEDRARIVARVAIEMASSVLDLLMTVPEPDTDALVGEATEAFVRYLEPWMDGRA